MERALLNDQVKRRADDDQTMALLSEHVEAHVRMFLRSTLTRNSRSWISRWRHLRKWIILLPGASDSVDHQRRRILFLNLNPWTPWRRI